jgi:hypothetical protein
MIQLTTKQMNVGTVFDHQIREKKNHRQLQVKMKIYKWKNLVIGKASFINMNHRDNITISWVLVILFRNYAHAHTQAQTRVYIH